MKKSYIMLIILLLLLLFSVNASAEIKINSLLTHKYNVTRGKKYQGKIILVNTGNEPEVVDLYLRDYSFNAQGQSYYYFPGKLSRSNSSWINLEKKEIKILAGEKKKIIYNIVVPDEKRLKGTYWSMIMIEPKKALPVRLANNIEQDDIAFRQNFRYGLQIITSIYNSGITNLKFSKPQLIKDKGECYFSINCKNTGENLLDLKTNLIIYNEFGKKLHEYQGIQNRIFPQTSVNWKIKMKNLKPGKYKAILIAKNNHKHFFANNYDLVLKN